MYRRKQHKRRNKHSSERIEPRNVTYKSSQNNHNNHNNHNISTYRTSSLSKKQRLIQVELEISEIVFKDGYKSSNEYDKLMLERWQLRFLLNQ